jgi:hypothetical protein
LRAEAALMTRNDAAGFGSVFHFHLNALQRSQASHQEPRRP